MNRSFIITSGRYGCIHTQPPDYQVQSLRLIGLNHSGDVNNCLLWYSVLFGVFDREFKDEYVTKDAKSLGQALKFESINAVCAAWFYFRDRF